MNQLVEISNTWSTFLVGRFGPFLWQSTILVTFIALATLLLKKASPVLRCWLWRLVALKLLLLPFWAINTSLPAWLATEEPSEVTQAAPVASPATVVEPVQSFEPPTAAQPTISQAPQATSPTSIAWKISWQTWLLFTWLSVVAYQVVRVASQRRALRRLLQQSEEAPVLAATVHKCANSLGMQTTPSPRQVNLELSPFVCGLRQPQLVLPKSLIDSAEPKRLRQIILHELAHVRRRDLLWCWIPSVMQIVYWFHPAAHWVAHRIQLEQELACDQMAIEHSGSSAGEYAETLIDVVSHTAVRIAAQAAFSAQFTGTPVTGGMQR